MNKNFTINSNSRYPFLKVSKNQTMMHIVEVEGEGVQPYLLVKTNDKFYQMAMEEITEETFNSYFEEDNSPT